MGSSYTLTPLASRRREYGNAQHILGWHDRHVRSRGDMPDR